MKEQDPLQYYIGEVLYYVALVVVTLIPYTIRKVLVAIVLLEYVGQVLIISALVGVFHLLNISGLHYEYYGDITVQSLQPLYYTVGGYIIVSEVLQRVFGIHIDLQMKKILIASLLLHAIGTAFLGIEMGWSGVFLQGILFVASSFLMLIVTLLNKYIDLHYAYIEKVRGKTIV